MTKTVYGQIASPEFMDVYRRIEEVMADDPEATHAIVGKADGHRLGIRDSTELFVNGALLTILVEDLPDGVILAAYGEPRITVDFTFTPTNDVVPAWTNGGMPWSNHVITWDNSITWDSTSTTDLVDWALDKP